MGGKRTKAKGISKYENMDQKFKTKIQREEIT